MLSGIYIILPIILFLLEIFYFCILANKIDYHY